MEQSKTSPLDAKLQWCEIGQHAVREVDPAKLRGRHLIMACPACRKHFPLREKVYWGKEQYKYYWDLGVSPVPLAQECPMGARRPYFATLTPQQVAWFKAAGYVVIRQKGGAEE